MLRAENRGNVDSQQLDTVEREGYAVTWSVKIHETEETESVNKRLVRAGYFNIFYKYESIRLSD